MNYNYAIVRGFAKSLVDEAQRIDDNHESISIEKIAAQKDEYYKVMEKIGIKLLFGCVVLLNILSLMPREEIQNFQFLLTSSL